MACQFRIISICFDNSTLCSYRNLNYKQFLKATHSGHFSQGLQNRAPCIALLFLYEILSVAKPSRRLSTFISVTIKTFASNQQIQIPFFYFYFKIFKLYGNFNTFGLKLANLKIIFIKRLLEYLSYIATLIVILIYLLYGFRAANCQQKSDRFGNKDSENGGKANKAEPW